MKQEKRHYEQSAAVQSVETKDIHVGQTPHPTLRATFSRHWGAGKNGFTLAEVLITLGIIGVVAAMTLPALIQNYQKKVLQNQFKKTYSQFQQNIVKSEADWGSKPSCYYYKSGWPAHHCVSWNADGDCTKYVLTATGEPLPPNSGGISTDCANFGKVFLKNLKVIKTCANKAYEKNCIPTYKGNDTLLKESNDSLGDYDLNKATSGTSGWRQKNILNNNSANVVADGVIILSFGGTFSPMYFAADVNGMKGPNQWGHDIFGFRLVAEDSIPLKLDGTGGAGVEKGGKSANAMIADPN